MFLENTFILCILISTLDSFEGSTQAVSPNSILSKDVSKNPKKHQKISHPKQKNEITEALSAKKVCMNVCNPPYYNQEYPPSYGSQHNPGGGQYNPGGGHYNLGGGQYNPGGGQYNPGGGQYNPGVVQYYPSGGQYIPGGWNQNYLPAGYGPLQDYFQNFDPGDGYQNFGENQFFPDGSFGDYISACYRNMFRRKYKFDPGHMKPAIFNYKTFVKRKNDNFRRNRSYRNYQDFTNCQLICYPVMIPSYSLTSTSSTTTSESNETNEENTSVTKKISPKPTTNKSKKSKIKFGHAGD